MKWEPVFPKIEIRKFNPKTAGKDKRERKEALKNKIGDAIGKELSKIQSRCLGNDLFIDVCFYLHQSEDVSDFKKDLDNLIKILFDVLAVNMLHGQGTMEGLGIMTDDSFIHRINCEKIIVNSSEKAGLDLSISRKVR